MAPLDQCVYDFLHGFIRFPNKSIISTMAKQAGVTEALKAIDQMEWVDRMNSVRNRAEEIILHELVYA